MAEATIIAARPSERAQRHLRRFVLTAGATFLSMGATCNASNPTPEVVRLAASRAVALIQKSQQNWFKRQQCSSCHHQILPAIAFREARERSIPIDEQSAHADAAKAFGSYPISIVQCSIHIRSTLLWMTAIVFSGPRRRVSARA